MSCLNCGHEARHRIDGKCPTFTAFEGWCTCVREEWGAIPSPAPAFHCGKAMRNKFEADTKAFRDKSVHKAEAEKRTRPRLGMAERMKLRGIKP